MVTKKILKKSNKKRWGILITLFLLGAIFCFWWNKAVYGRALNYYNENKKEEAYVWFGYYLEIPLSFSKVESAHQKRGEYLLERGSLEEAYSEFLDARRLNRNDRVLNLTIAQVLIDLGRCENARFYIEDVLKNDPKDSEAWSLLGYSYYLLNQKESARENWKKALEVDAESAWSNWYLGSLYLDKNLEESKGNLKVASQKDGFEKKDEAEKILNFLNEFDLEKKSSDYLKVVIARSFLEAGEKELALIYIDKVLETQKEYRDAWVVRGAIYESLEKIDLARRDFLEALRLDPENEEIRNFLNILEE
jgi:Tfp pilus assembly protein PilF